MSDDPEESHFVKVRREITRSFRASHVAYKSRNLIMLDKVGAERVSLHYQAEMNNAGELEIIHIRELTQEEIEASGIDPSKAFSSDVVDIYVDSPTSPLIEPPRLAEFLLGFFVSRERREELVGDAAERYIKDVKRFGEFWAGVYYARVIASVILGRGVSAVEWTVGIIDKIKRLG